MKNLILFILVSFFAAGNVQAQEINIPESAILFKNVKVFNGYEDRLLDIDVLVVGNKIKKIEQDIPTSGTWEIDVKGGVKKIQGAIGGTDTYSFTIYSPDEGPLKKQVAEAKDIIKKK